MRADHPSLAKPWYRTNRKNLAIFTLMWTGEGFLFVAIGKRIFHASAAVYLFIFFGGCLYLVMVLCPKWFVRVIRAIEDKANRSLNRAEKWWDLIN